MRLGVPAFYANLMADLNVHMVRSTVTASGTAAAAQTPTSKEIDGRDPLAFDKPMAAPPPTNPPPRVSDADEERVCCSRTEEHTQIEWCQGHEVFP